MYSAEDGDECYHRSLHYFLYGGLDPRTVAYDSHLGPSDESSHKGIAGSHPRRGSCVSLSNTLYLG
jgi:hypothetical protein